MYKYEHFWFFLQRSPQTGHANLCKEISVSKNFKKKSFLKGVGYNIAEYLKRSNRSEKNNNNSQLNKEK